MIALLAVLMGATPAPAEVPFGSLDWVEPQWLGAGANGIAIRELRLPDVGEEKLCEYPGVAKLSAPGPGDNRNGVRLITWPMPGVGTVVTPKALKTFPIYVPGVESKGCTAESAAKIALDLAKTYWKEQNIDFEKRVFSQKVWADQDDAPFVGSCFKTRSSAAGCALKKKAADVELTVKLVASSDCIKAVGDSFEHGCNADRVYSGTLTTEKKRYPFSIHVLKPTSETSVQSELRAVDIVTFEPYQFAVFTFAPVFLSQREKTQVLLRLR